MFGGEISAKAIISTREIVKTSAKDHIKSYTLMRYLLRHSEFC